MGKVRILWADNLKAFAIILVILGHVIPWVCGEQVSPTLIRYFSVIEMPLFMAISGYCSYKPSVSLANIRKRFFQLVIPFFAWPIVWYVMKMNFSGVTDFYMHLPLNPDTGLWFLYILFLISLVDFVRSKMVCLVDVNRLIFFGGKIKIVQYVYELSIVGTIILLLFVYWAYKHLGLSGNWISFLALYYPYYMFGCVMRKHNEWLEKRLCLLGSIGMFVYIFGTYFFDGPIWQPVLAVSGILGTFFVFRRFCDCKMPQLIMFTGMSTLGIYAVHQPVINYVKHIVETPIWVDVTVTFVITYIISIVVVIILKMTKLTRFLFLGMNRHLTTT